MRRVIEISLRGLNARIMSAGDGLSGLEMALEFLPSVIVLDIGLPGIDGWEVLARLRANDAARDIKILILTAHADPGLDVLAKERGADAFMTKPFLPSDLWARIAELIARPNTEIQVAETA